MWITKALRRVTLAHARREFPFNNKGFALNEGETHEQGFTRLEGELAASKSGDWKQGIDEGMRNNPSLEKFTNAGDLAKSYVEIQKLVGMDKLPLPKDMSKATPEEWATIYSRLGRPENSDGYKLPELKRPDGYPEVDAEEVKGLLTKAHDLGLLPHQINGLFEHFMGGEFAKFSKFGEDNEKGRFAAETELRKEWGKSFDEKKAQGDKIVNTYGNDEFRNWLIAEGLHQEPQMIKFLSFVGSKLSEDALKGIPSASFTKTPDEAKKEIAQIQGDMKNPYHADKQHPEHALMVQKMADLHALAYPEKAE